MSHTSFRAVGLLMILAVVLAACVPVPSGGGGAVVEPEAVSGELVVYSGRSEALIQPVLDAFEEKYPDVNVVLKSGKNAELANALLEEQANPQADVFITTEVMTAQALFEQDAFDNYLSPLAANIPAEYREPGGGWTGLTLRARVIMVNTDLVSPEDAPTSVLDLTDPKWKGQIAAADSTNGSMQAHLAALKVLIGEEATEEWVSGLLANEVTFFGGHTDVRKAVGAGEFALGLVNHYYYHLQKDEGSPVDVVYPDQGEDQMGTVVNATAVAVVRGARHPAAAQTLVDFLLSRNGQKLFAELNYEYPLIPGVALHADVLPLDEFRVAEVDLRAAAADRDWVFDLIDRLGMP